MAIDLKPLAQAIDRYLAKADKDLETQLDAEGFTAAHEAVEAINRIEDDVTEATQTHVDTVLDMISTEEGLRQFVENTVPEIENADQLKADLKQIFRNEFDKMVREFVFSFVNGQDPELDTTDRMITQETQSTIVDWVNKLTESTARWVEPATVNAVQRAVDKVGNNVDKVTQELLDSGVRDTEWKARRLATTEVLRMESIGQQDAFIQDPSCYKKEWVYTYQANDPRENHIAMNGQQVFKRDPFNLRGADGTMYHPMYPRDPGLPAGESINCHCIMRSVSDDKVLGMTKEERTEMRRKALEDADRQWQEEHGHDNIDAYKSLSADEQNRYFGGKKQAAPYKSLVNSEVVSTDEQLAKLFGADKRPKSLQELQADGIFTVNDQVMEHVLGKKTGLGNPKLPPSPKNGGVIKTGGHTQDAIDFFDKYKIKYNIEKTYENGVRVGGFETAKEHWRGLGTAGHSWFPKDWDADKVRDAGTYALNHYATMMHGEGANPKDYYFANYDGVTVTVQTLPGTRDVTSVYPDNDQRLLKEK